ncbi:MAG: TRAP transporter small permease [Desulfobacterales bacterium]|nr:TRAP transporter small permease [Desulfobacterales bacterium]
MTTKKIKKSLSNINKIDALVTNVTKWTCFSLLILLVVNITVAISFRYIFYISFSFSEKLSIYLMIWFTFLGASLCIKYRRHISVDIFVNILPPKIQWVINVFGQVVVSTFLVLMVYYSMVHVNQQPGVEPMVFYIKKAYFSSVLPFSLFLMLYQLNVDHLKKLIDKSRGDPKTEND